MYSNAQAVFAAVQNRAAKIVEIGGLQASKIQRFEVLAFGMLDGGPVVVSLGVIKNDHPAFGEGGDGLFDAVNTISAIDQNQIIFFACFSGGSTIKAVLVLLPKKQRYIGGDL
jgi:hypothetical protein